MATELSPATLTKMMLTSDESSSDECKETPEVRMAEGVRYGLACTHCHTGAKTCPAEGCHSFKVTFEDGKMHCLGPTCTAAWSGPATCQTCGNLAVFNRRALVKECTPSGPQALAQFECLQAALREKYHREADSTSGKISMRDEPTDNDKAFFNAIYPCLPRIHGVDWDRVCLASAEDILSVRSAVVEGLLRFKVADDQTTGAWPSHAHFTVKASMLKDAGGIMMAQPSGRPVVSSNEMPTFRVSRVVDKAVCCARELHYDTADWNNTVDGVFEGITVHGRPDGVYGPHRLPVEAKTLSLDPCDLAGHKLGNVVVQAVRQLAAYQFIAGGADSPTDGFLVFVNEPTATVVVFKVPARAALWARVAWRTWAAYPSLKPMWELCRRFQAAGCSDDALQEVKSAALALRRRRGDELGPRRSCLACGVRLCIANLFGNCKYSAADCHYCHFDECQGICDICEEAVSRHAVTGCRPRHGECGGYMRVCDVQGCDGEACRFCHCECTTCAMPLAHHVLSESDGIMLCPRTCGSCDKVATPCPSGGACGDEACKLCHCTCDSCHHSAVRCRWGAQCLHRETCDRCHCPCGDCGGDQWCHLGGKCRLYSCTRCHCHCACPSSLVCPLGRLCQDRSCRRCHCHSQCRKPRCQQGLSCDREGCGGCHCRCGKCGLDACKFGRSCTRGNACTFCHCSCACKSSTPCPAGVACFDVDCGGCHCVPRAAGEGEGEGEMSKVEEGGCHDGHHAAAKCKHGARCFRIGLGCPDCHCPCETCGRDTYCHFGGRCRVPTCERCHCDCNCGSTTACREGTMCRDVTCHLCHCHARCRKVERCQFGSSCNDSECDGCHCRCRQCFKFSCMRGSRCWGARDGSCGFCHHRCSCLSDEQCAEGQDCDNTACKKCHCDTSASTGSLSWR